MSIDFIRDELHLQHNSNSIDVDKLQKMFCDLIGFLLKNGMPMELFSNRSTFQEMNQKAINAEESLLAILGIFSRLTKQIFHIDFPTPDAFGSLLSRLQGQKQNESNPISFYCLNYLDLSNCLLIFRVLPRQTYNMPFSKMLISKISISRVLIFNVLILKVLILNMPTSKGLT